MDGLILSFDDLEKSQYIQARKPPRIISLFLYLLIFMFSAAILFAWFGKIEIVIKSHGTIRPEKTISRIRSASDGRIVDIHYYPGKIVEEGDILIELDGRSSERELERIVERISALEEKHEGLSLLKEILDTGENILSVESGEFFHRYSLYQSRKTKLEIDLAAAEQKLSRRESMSQYVAKSELDDLENQLLMAGLELKSYTSDYYLSVTNEMEETIQRLRSLLSQVEKLEKEIEISTIRAPISGIVNSLISLNKGDYLFAGTEILDIIPENRGSGKVEILLSNKDIAGIKTGDPVSYRLPALPKEKYGVLRGEIVSIPADMDEAEGGFFRVVGSFDDSNFQRGEYDFVELKSGMFVEARILVRKRRIVFHLLDKLGLLRNAAVLSSP